MGEGRHVFADGEFRAVIEPDGRGGFYRYTLVRIWDASKPLFPVMMLNPSKAGTVVDGKAVGDPTATVLCKYAAAHGAGGLDVRNLFALQSSDPKALLKHPDPVGPKNDAWLSQFFRTYSIVVAAWGPNGALDDRDQAVMSRAAAMNVCLNVFGLTKDGSPWHPLRKRLGPLVSWQSGHVDAVWRV